MFSRNPGRSSSHDDHLRVLIIFIPMTSLLNHIVFPQDFLAEPYCLIVDWQFLVYPLDAIMPVCLLYSKAETGTITRRPSVDLVYILMRVWRHVLR